MTPLPVLMLHAAWLLIYRTPPLSLPVARQIIAHASGYRTSAGGRAGAPQDFLRTDVDGDQLVTVLHGRIQYGCRCLSTDGWASCPWARAAPASGSGRPNGKIDMVKPVGRSHQPMHVRREPQVIGITMPRTVRCTWAVAGSTRSGCRRALATMSDFHPASGKDGAAPCRWGCRAVSTQLSGQSR